MPNVDLQPDLSEVLQEEIAPVHEGLPVPVRIVGPVRAQILPAKSSSTKTVAVGTTPIRILQANHRRSRILLMATGGAMRVAFNTASKETPASMALWPVNVPLELLGDDEVWVMGDAGNISVSLVASRWADGEDGGS